MVGFWGFCADSTALLHFGVAKVLYCLHMHAIFCRQYSTFATRGSKSAVLSAENCRNVQTVQHFCCLEWQKCCTVCRKLPQPSLDPVVGPPLDPAPEVHGIIKTLIIKWREKSRRPRSGNDDPATERSDDTAGDPELRHGPLRSWVPPLIPLPKCTE